jgi:hypothetical protein
MRRRSDPEPSLGPGGSPSGALPKSRGVYFCFPSRCEASDFDQENGEAEASPYSCEGKEGAAISIEG